MHRTDFYKEFLSLETIFWSRVSVNVFVTIFCIEKNHHVGACKKFSSDLGLGGVFAGYSGFLHQLQLASQDLPALIIGRKSDKKRNSKFQLTKC